MNNIFAQANNFNDKLEILSKHFVRMQGYGIYFPIDNGEIDYKSPISSGDLILRLKDLGLRDKDADIKLIINTDKIEEKTLLDVIYDEIPKWDKRDRFSEMVESLNLIGSNEKNKLLILKFFMTAYSMAFDGIDQNINWKYFPRVVMILHSEERTFGKTSFFRKVFFDGVINKKIPSLDIELYAELNGTLGVDKKERIAFLSNYIGINIDDIDEMIITKKDEGQLRSLLTSRASSSRTFYKESTKHQKRRASICGTTNNSTLLRDKEEDRYMVFTLKKEIDFKIFEEEDFIFQLWSQIKHEAHNHGDGVQFNSVDRRLIREIAEAYLYKEEFEHYLDEILIHQDHGTMRFNQVKEKLWTAGFNGVSPNAIAKALQRLTPSGKSYKRKSGIQMYNFRFATDEEKEDISRVGRLERQFASEKR